MKIKGQSCNRTAQHRANKIENQHQSTAYKSGECLGNDIIALFCTDGKEVLCITRFKILRNKEADKRCNTHKHHIDIEIDEDFVPVYEYFNVQLSKPIIEFKPERHIDIDEYNDDYVHKMMAEQGMIPVTRVVKTYRTTVTLVRKGKRTTISYTLQEAIDAGLKSGKNSITGSDVKGKDNWDKHTRSLMRKMAIMIAARICANDILNGMYCDVELKDVKSINDDYVDVQYVEADDNANY